MNKSGYWQGVDGMETWVPVAYTDPAVAADHLCWAWVYLPQQSW